MTTRDNDHKPPAECEYIRGLHVYFDEDIDAYTAYHNRHPVSATGESKQSAVENCRSALDDYHDGAGAHWDMWAMACPECDNGRLNPLKASCRDPLDTRVECCVCGTRRQLIAVPPETGTKLCPNCDEDIRVQMTGMGNPLKCPECGDEYEIREFSYLASVDG